MVTLNVILSICISSLPMKLYDLFQGLCTKFSVIITGLSVDGIINHSFDVDILTLSKFHVPWMRLSKLNFPHEANAIADNNNTLFIKFDFVSTNINKKLI